MTSTLTNPVISSVEVELYLYTGEADELEVELKYTHDGEGDETLKVFKNDDQDDSPLTFGTSASNPVIFRDGGSSPSSFTGGVGILKPNNGSSSNFDDKFEGEKAVNI